MLHWANMNSLPIFFATNSKLMQLKDLNILPLWIALHTIGTKTVMDYKMCMLIEFTYKCKQN
jgi:hypothetical protein